MPKTIEAFVAKLQEEGVQAGQAQAEKLVVQANSQAQDVLATANTQAEKILADANAQAESLLARAKTDMELASRDTVARLRETLSKAITAILSDQAKAALSDEAFLADAVKQVIHAGATDITVTDEMKAKLQQGALTQLAGDTNLAGQLKQAGFEYKQDGATVEVTADSVVQQLCSMVTPALQKTLKEATA